MLENELPQIETKDGDDEEEEEDEFIKEPVVVPLKGDKISEEQLAKIGINDVNGTFVDCTDEDEMEMWQEFQITGDKRKREDGEEKIKLLEIPTKRRKTKLKFMEDSEQKAVENLFK